MILLPRNHPLGWSGETSDAAVGRGPTRVAFANSDRQRGVPDCRRNHREIDYQAALNSAHSSHIRPLHGPPQTQHRPRRPNIRSNNSRHTAHTPAPSRGCELVSRRARKANRFTLAIALMATVSSPAVASVTYAAYPNAPLIGDGTTAQGGIAPAYSTEPADIASNFTVSDWISSTTSFPGSSAGAEAKFRTFCHFSHVKADDPVVKPGQPGASHLHMFFGNTLTDANSTYTSLRTTGNSTCGAGIINRSAYWVPALIYTNPLGDGIDRVVKPDYAVVYYAVGDTEKTIKTRVARGFRMIGGFNPADPNDDAVKLELAAAPSSMSYSGNGFLGWKCETVNGSNANSPRPGNASQPYLLTADGLPTLTCPSTDRLAADLEFPTCWNGTDLTSSNGRLHMRYRQRRNSDGKSICPQGYYQIFKFELVVWFQKGLDLTKLYLSSDRMTGMQQFLSGQSWHADWFGAWDYGTTDNPGLMMTFMQLCTGTTIPDSILTTVGHSCGDSQFGDGRKGLEKGAPPDGSVNPGTYTGYQLDVGTNWASQPLADRFLDIPAGSSGSGALMYGHKGGKGHKAGKGHKH